MPRLSQLQRGFTLMELLVVIIVISIAFSLLITVSFSPSRPGEDIQQEAYRLQQRLIFAHEQAVIRAEEYGLYFDEEGYIFMRLDQGQWQPIADDRLLAKHELPDDMILELDIEQINIVLQGQTMTPTESDEIDRPKPQVFLLSSSETTPTFIARLRIPGEYAAYEVHGTSNGRYELHATE